MRNSHDEIPGVKKQGHRIWFVNAAKGMGFATVDQISDERRIEARVNHGRWLVDCPYDLGSELLDPSEPVFVCLSCGNLGFNEDTKLQGDGLLLEIDFPVPGQMRQIEKLLSARPKEINRNWSPGETVGDLQRENEEHGIGPIEDEPQKGR